MRKGHSCLGFRRSSVQSTRRKGTRRCAVSRVVPDWGSEIADVYRTATGGGGQEAGVNRRLSFSGFALGSLRPQRFLGGMADQQLLLPGAVSLQWTAAPALPRGPRVLADGRRKRGRARVCEGGAKRRDRFFIRRAFVQLFFCLRRPCMIFAAAGWRPFDLARYRPNRFHLVAPRAPLWATLVAQQVPERSLTNVVGDATWFLLTPSVDLTPRVPGA